MEAFFIIVAIVIGLTSLDNARVNHKKDNISQNINSVDKIQKQGIL